MKLWEKKLRENLEKSLPNKMYNIGTDEIICFTGKLGYIDFKVAIEKEVRDSIKNNEFNLPISVSMIPTPGVTEKDIEDFINNFLDKINNGKTEDAE